MVLGGGSFQKEGGREEGRGGGGGRGERGEKSGRGLIKETDEPVQGPITDGVEEAEVEGGGEGGREGGKEEGGGHFWFGVGGCLASAAAEA